MNEKIKAMSKTAMTDLFERYGHLLPDVQEQYMQTEKEQIVDAFSSGQDRIFTPEEYYKLTFNPKTDNNG